MQIGKLTQIGKSVAAVIPAAYRRELGWLLGDYVEVAINERTIVLRNLKPDAIKTRKTTSARGANDLTGVTKRLRLPRR